MKNLIYVTCFVMFTMSSCYRGKKIKSEPNNIDFKEYAMDSTYHLFGDADKPSIKINLSMHYPVKYKDQSILDSIQRLIITNVTTSSNQMLRNPEEAMRNFIIQKTEEYRSLEKDYNAAFPEVKDEEFINSFSNEYIAEGKNVFNRDGILCFSTSVYSFTGGAHGLNTIKYTCVNLDNGSVITNKDLFTDESELLLTTIILEKLVEIQKVKSTEELEKNGFFDISDIKPNDNFYLNEKGITYVYNPYEIAAYYIGISEIFIPYEEVTVILTPQSPIKRFLD